jgi:hypothetical protein
MRAAAARVHGGDQLKARWVGDAVVGAGDHRLAGFERLAQRIEHLRMEFRKLIEKQHAEISERDFAWPRPRAATDECRHAR